MKENETELKEMLVDVQKENENELKQWQQMERFAKIEKLRIEKGYDKIEDDSTRPTWREKNCEIKIEKKKLQNMQLENISTTPKAKNQPKSMSASVPVGGEEEGGETQV